MTWVRAAVAAGLSLVLPGAGHALIRDWVRALLFAGLFVSAVAILLPADAVVAAESPIEAVEVALAETPATHRFLLSFTVLFAAIDAGLRAAGVAGAESTDGPTCPDCGRELDEDLEFCHWCTARIEPEEDEPVGP